MRHASLDDSTLGAITRATRNLEVALQEQGAAGRYEEAHPSEPPSTFKLARFLMRDEDIAQPMPDFLRKLRAALHLRNELLHNVGALEIADADDVAEAAHVIQMAADLILLDESPISCIAVGPHDAGAAHLTSVRPAGEPSAPASEPAVSEDPTLTRGTASELNSIVSDLDRLLANWTPDHPPMTWISDYTGVLRCASTETSRRDAEQASAELLKVLDKRRGSLVDEIERNDRLLFNFQAGFHTSILSLLLFDLPFLTAMYAMAIGCAALILGATAWALDAVGALHLWNAWTHGSRLGALIGACCLVVHEIRLGRASDRWLPPDMRATAFVLIYRGVIYILRLRMESGRARLMLLRAAAIERRLRRVLTDLIHAASQAPR